MFEYLSKGTVPAKTVHAFKKWDLTTTLGSSIRTWVVVYDDKSHVQLTNKDFYSLLTNGHKNKDEEKSGEKSEEITGSRGIVSDAIAKVTQTDKKEVPIITTPEEKEELEELRKKSIGEILHNAVKNDYEPNPAATGYEDSK